MIVKCPNCEGTDVIKNGQTRHKKQNLKCKTCDHQFTLTPRHRISPKVKVIILRLLAENVPVAVIARAAKVSKKRVYDYRKDLAKTG
jgi:predicted Zn finger-like uncharacterized protein